MLSWNALHLLVVLEPQAAESPHGDERRLGATLDKEGRFVINGVTRGAYHINLVPVDGTAVNARSRGTLLGSIRVEDDVSGLLFESPNSSDLN